MNEPNVNESMESQAFESVQPGMKDAIRKLMQAGLPWGTILKAIITYGPAFIQMIENIIKDWKDKNPTQTV